VLSLNDVAKDRFTGQKTLALLLLKGQNSRPLALAQKATVK